MSLKGSSLEDYIAHNLSRLFPDLKLYNRYERVTNKLAFDLHAKGLDGIDYFIEVKNSECNRLNIGQIVEYKANLDKIDSKAKIILVCKDADVSLKDTLRKIGVDIRTFSDLEIPNDISSPENGKTGLMLSPTEQKAYFSLLKCGLTVAQAEDLSSILDIPPTRAKNILSKLARHGVAQRVGKGKYTIIPADVVYGRKSYVADPLVLVSELLKETNYYTAYISATHIHGITEQIPFKTTIAVRKQRRPIKIGNIYINFITLKDSRFFGYEEVSYMNTTLKVSDLEKTVIDCIDRQELCGGIPEVARTITNAFETGKLNPNKLVSYAKKYRSHAVAQRLGFIIDHLKESGRIKVEPRIIDELLRLTGSKVYPLDIKAQKKGETSRKWRILNNAGVFEV